MENQSTFNQEPLFQTQNFQESLPNATAVLILGILSIAGCFCYGLTGIVLGIIAIVLAVKAKKLYEQNPGRYTEASFKNMNAGKVCAIIGLSLSAMYLITLLIYIFIIGTALTGLFYGL